MQQLPCSIMSRATETGARSKVQPDEPMAVFVVNATSISGMPG